MDTIGERIVFLREMFGMSQKTLAQKSFLTEASLSRYENNLREPKAQVVINLATSLNTSTDFLLCQTDNYLPVTKNEVWKAVSKEEYSYIQKYKLLNYDYRLKINERIETFLEQQIKK